MAADLSCNWKRLQASFNQLSTATSTQETDKYTVDRCQKDSSAKRRKQNSRLSKTSNMEKFSTASKPHSENIDLTQETTAQILPMLSSNNSLQSWAQHHDISASDLAEAYGDDHVNGAKVLPDVINGGLKENVTIGKYVALDCEMVGVGVKERSALARVSIVNFHGHQIYDSYVKPKELVTNWRTPISGITPRSMRKARDLKDVQETVASILKDRIVIGHSLGNDFRVMHLSHPKRDLRDTSTLSEFRRFSNNRTPSLKLLAQKVLGVEIQSGQHSSLEDARAAMLLFRRYKSSFDAESPPSKPGGTPGPKSKTPKKKKKKDRGQ